MISSPNSPSCLELGLPTERAVRLAKAADTGKAGHVAIAFLSPLGGLLLPRIILDFRRNFPFVDVDLLEMVPRMQVEALLDNQIDQLISR